MKSDAESRQEVLNGLESDVRAKASRIGVVVNDGLTASSDVVSHNESTDADIATSATNKICWAATVPAGCVKVLVEDGWVTLKGEVNWQFQKEALGASVKAIRGVIGVSNDIELRPLVTMLGVKDQIEKAFERHAQIDTRNIRIETKGTKIALYGTVSSYIERKEAEHVTWATPGVAEFEDDLFVASGEC